MSQDKVNFLIVGAQKSGTTALDKYLRGHNEVAMALRKELHFFDNDKFFNQSTVDYSIYHRFFPKNNMKIKGECTPIYMYLPPVMRRVYEYNSKMKIIAILRNPLQRAFSGWNMQHIRKVDNLDFSSAIRNEASRCREALPDYHRDFSYISRGFYSEQIRRIWHFFPKEQTLFIKHEDLKNSPNVVLEKLSHFLGVAQFEKVEITNVHSRPYSISLSHEDFLYLRKTYIHEINHLESMLGWDCASWKEEF